MDEPALRIGVDIGGTFTDFVLYDETRSELHSFKVLSTRSRPIHHQLHSLPAPDCALPRGGADEETHVSRG